MNVALSNLRNAHRARPFGFDPPQPPRKPSVPNTPLKIRPPICAPDTPPPARPVGPKLVSFEELPDIFKIHPELRNCLNLKCPAVTKRLYAVFERLLSHPRFKGHKNDKLILFLMDLPGPQAFISTPQSASLFDYTACFISMELLHELFKNTGSLCDDSVAFVLAHELTHYAFRKENHKTDLTMEEERECDIEALKIMDDLGYSVHFAGFVGWFGNKISGKSEISPTHPDTWWRQMNIEEQLNNRHFPHYSETSKFPFDEAAAREVAAVQGHGRPKKEAQDLFLRTDFDSYLGQVERIDSAEELILHIPNLFMHFARKLIILAQKSKKLRDLFLGKEIYTIDQCFDPPVIDPESDHHYLDCVDLDKLGVKIDPKLYADDRFFKNCRLSPNRKVAARQRRKIIEIYAKSQVLNAFNYHLFHDPEKGCRQFFEDRKDLAALLFSAMGRIFSLASRDNPALRPMVSFIKHCIGIHGYDPTRLRFTRQELGALLDNWPSEAFFEQWPAHPLFSDKELTAIQGWSLRALHKGINLRSISPSINKALISCRESPALHQQLGKKIFRTVPNHHAGDLVFFKRIDLDFVTSGLILDTYEPIFDSEKIKSHVQQLMGQVRDKKSRGLDCTEELSDILYFMELAIDYNVKDQFLLDNFEFFEENLFPHFADILTGLSRRKDFCPLPKWAESEDAKELFRFIRFITRPQFIKYKQKGLVKNPAVPVFDRSLKPSEQKKLAGLVLANFDKIYSALGPRNEVILLYIQARLIQDDGRLNFAARPALEDEFDEYHNILFSFDGHECYVGRYMLELIDVQKDLLPSLGNRPYKTLIKYGLHNLPQKKMRQIIIKLLKVTAERSRKGEAPGRFDDYLAELRYHHFLDILQQAGIRYEVGKIHSDFKRESYFGNFLEYGPDYSLRLKGTGRFYCLDFIRKLFVSGKISAKELLFILPDHLAVHFMKDLLRAGAITAEELSKFDELLPSMPIDLKAGAQLHPSKRIYTLKATDYAHYLLFLEEHIGTGQQLTDYLNSRWSYASDLRDAAIIKFIEKTKPALADLTALSPLFKKIDRIADRLLQAYEEWRKENPNASYDEGIRMIKGLFPQRSANRDRLILAWAKKHPLDLPRFLELSALLLEENKGQNRSMLFEHGLLLAMNRYTAQEKKQLLLWAIGYSRILPGKIACDLQNQKLEAEWVKEALSLPDERQRFLKTLLIGAEGLCVNSNQETKNELFNDIFAHLFGARLNAKQQFILDITKIIFAEVAPYKQYAMLEALIDRILHAAKNKQKVTLEDVIRIFLENVGPEGVKLAQILSSYQALWQTEPELARTLSDLQDESSLMHHYYLFKHLIDEFGEEKVAALTIDPPAKAGSIKGFFVAREQNGNAFGLLYLRPQVVKFLERSRDEMERILERAEPVLAKYYGGKIPPHVPELVFELIRREVNFGREQSVLGHFSGAPQGIFSFPAPLTDWQNSTVIGETYVCPSVSFKRLLALEQDPSEWKKISETERSQIRQMMGRRKEAPFIRKEFCEKLRQIKISIQRGLLSQLVDEEYFHIDPHPGNILIGVEGGEPRVFLTDLGAMVPLPDKDRKFLAGALSALTVGDPTLLGQVINKYFGREIGSDWEKEVLSAEIKYRPVRFLEKLDGLGLKLPLAVREFLLAISKADPVLNVYEENMPFYLELFTKIAA